MSSVFVGRRADRTAVFVSLAGITAIAWTLTVQLTAGMPMPAGSMDLASAMPSAGRQLVLVSGMWAAMMVGMMVPSATPMVVAFTDWTRRGPIRGTVWARSPRSWPAMCSSGWGSACSPRFCT